MALFTSLAEVMEDLQNKVKQKSKYTENSRQQDEHGVVDCPICKDMEFILEKDEKGNEIAIPCSCRERKAWKRRFKNALIPSEFENASLEKFEIHNDMQKGMHDMTDQYLEKFSSINDTKRMPAYNYEYTATIGEQRMKELPASEPT